MNRNAMRWPLQDEDKGDGDKGGGKETDEPSAEQKALETEAAGMGWTDKTRFKGDPAKWVDAATFVKNGKESLPILRDRLRKAEAANAELAKTAADFKKMSDENFAKGYAKAKATLEAQIEAGAEAGGKEGAAAVKAAAKELTDLETEKAKREAKGDDDPEFKAWELSNDWYRDPELRDEAEVEAFRLRKKGNKLEGAAFLDAVKDAVKKKHPEKFGNPRRNADNGGVERPNSGGDGGGEKKGWDKLPKDAQEAGERYIKQKLFKDKAEYAKSYFEQN